MILFRPALVQVPPPPGFAHRSEALGLAAVALVSAAFGLSFGLNFGAGNQVTYLVPALRLLEPSLLERDWFATQTTHYHPTFAYFAAALMALDRGGWALAVALPLVVTAAGLAIYSLVRALAPPRVALPAFLLVIALAFVTRTGGPAVTYVFDSTLQPSTLSSALFLGAAAAFVRARFAWSGGLLAASGLFHVNLLVLLLPTFALAQLLLARAGAGQRLLVQLGPPVGALLALSPLLIRAGTATDEADFARHVYVAIRAPHHFELAGKESRFVPALGWLLAGTALALARLRRGPDEPLTRFVALIAGLVVVVGTGTVAALASERAATFFAWRLVPHLALLLSTFVCIELVRHVTGLMNRRWEAGIVTGAAALLLLNFAAGPLARIPRHSNLLRTRQSPLEQLERWLRERSPRRALFLAPPELDSLRLRGERAIVVDWKSNPALPDELLEWYRRVSAITGKRELRGEADLKGYDALDAPRLEALRHRYGFEFAIVRAFATARLPSLRRVYENGEYVVLEMPPE